MTTLPLVLIDQAVSWTEAISAFFKAIQAYSSEIKAKKSMGPSPSPATRKKSPILHPHILHPLMGLRSQTAAGRVIWARIMKTSPFPAERILLGPGPSPVPQRVLRALAAPTLGHLDPQYLGIMDETCDMLRQVFQTRNPLTFPVSGTGMAGMECIAVNLIEPGDEVIVCVNGVFGGRMKDVMERCGAVVHPVEAPWGEVISNEQIASALEQYPKTRLVGIVHAETSTGAHQPLAGLGELVHARGALLIVDAVTSLGGHDLRVDDWGIDAIYSGTQKCLSCPPGLAPVSFGERALK